MGLLLNRDKHKEEAPTPEPLDTCNDPGCPVCYPDNEVKGTPSDDELTEKEDQSYGNVSDAEAYERPLSADEIAEEYNPSELPTGETVEEFTITANGIVQVVLRVASDKVVLVQFDANDESEGVGYALWETFDVLSKLLELVAVRRIAGSLEAADSIKAAFVQGDLEDRNG